MPSRQNFMVATVTALSVAVLWCIGAAVAPAAAADVPELRVAVAANFKQTLEKLTVAFGTQSARFIVSSGASGMLYSQIVQGAPFDMYFSADVQRPAKLESEGLIEAGSRFTYAVGILALWRPNVPAPHSVGETLRAGGLRTLAIANPKLAPYGAAAMQVLQREGLWSTPPFKVVMGESLGQTYQFVVSGNADAGFVALSQLREAHAGGGESHEGVLIVDSSLHAPIEQQVVLLAHARNKQLAREFLVFVRGDVGRRIIAAAGYE